MTNKKELNELKKIYENLIEVEIFGLLLLDKIDYNKYEYKMELEYILIKFMEEYFKIEFDEYIFKSYEKDPELCSTTMYICWN